MGKDNTAKERLIVALDFPVWEDAEKMVESLPEVSLFKVGLELYLASKGQAVHRLKELGKDVFLDLKFHDIPNTVAQACRQAISEGAFMFNVHSSGGREMMRQAVLASVEEAAKKNLPKPLLLAVTILTSLDDQDLQKIGMSGVKESVGRLAVLAKEAGIDGVVASPQEIQLIRQMCGPDFKIICPGVRPLWAAQGDQKRVLTPGEAISAGADFLVVGRPITKAKSPNEAALKIIEEIKEALV